MVGTGRFGVGGDAEGGSVGGTDGGGGGYGWDGDRYRRPIKLEYVVATIILGMEPNSPLEYDPGLKPTNRL